MKPFLCIDNLQMLIQDVYGVIILLEYVMEYEDVKKNEVIAPLSGEPDKEIKQSSDASPINQKIFNVE